MKKMIHYEIVIQGLLSPEYSDWFADADITTKEAGGESMVTVISGEVVDQAALHGLLNRIRDLGLTLISIESGRLSK
jgi:hypothetical protein